jgi:DNA polymerase III subunit epsilon
MSLLHALFPCAPSLDKDIEARVARWRALPEPSPHTRIEDARFVVIDVETTGLDVHRSDLLSVGLVPVYLDGIELGGLTEILVRRENNGFNRETLVVHGITPTESAAGVDTEEALTRVLEHVEKSWLVAFHADFDRAMLGRATRRHLGVKLTNPFLDMAWLLPAFHPEASRGLQSLDDWLGHFGIPAPARHRASGDALVTGELLLMVLAEARRRDIPDVRALIRLARAQSQLHGFMRH